MVSTVLHDTGEFWEVTVGVPDPTRPLKVTLAWSESRARSAPIHAGQRSESDRDRRRDHLQRQCLQPRLVDQRRHGPPDNLENVYLRTHGDTATTIRVEAANLPGDAVLYDHPTDQSFALICANCTAATSPLAAMPAPARPCTRGSAMYTLTVGLHPGLRTNR